MVFENKVCKPTVNFQDRFVAMDGSVYNGNGLKLKPVKGEYYSVKPIEGKRTRITTLVLVLEAWYNTKQGIQIKRGDDYNPSNIVTFANDSEIVTHHGLKYGYSDRFESVCCEDGTCYNITTNTRRIPVIENRRGYIYYIGGKRFTHTEVMLDAFGYLTIEKAFDVDVFKVSTMKEILNSYDPSNVTNKRIRARDKGIRELVNDYDEYVSQTTSTPVPITDDMILGEFRGVTVTKCGLIVDPNNPTKSVGYNLFQRLPMYKGIPVKYWVYNAFKVGNKQFNHRLLMVKDGDAFNTAFDNIENKGR